MVTKVQQSEISWSPPANAVIITGGTIDGTLIGGTTPAVGHYTTLTATTPNPGDSSNNVATTAFVTGLSTQPTYVNTSRTLQSGGVFQVDTSAGTITLTLEPSPNPGDSYTFVDQFGTWAVNNMIINGNGKYIMGSMNNLIGDTVGYSSFTIVYKSTSTNWVLQ